jgi:hypothetical protein
MAEVGGWGVRRGSCGDEERIWPTLTRGTNDVNYEPLIPPTVQGSLKRVTGERVLFKGSRERPRFTK